MSSNQNLKNSNSRFFSIAYVREIESRQIQQHQQMIWKIDHVIISNIDFLSSFQSRNINRFVIQIDLYFSLHIRYLLVFLICVQCSFCFALSLSHLQRCFWIQQQFTSLVKSHSFRSSILSKSWNSSRARSRYSHWTTKNRAIFLFSLLYY